MDVRPAERTDLSVLVVDDHRLFVDVLVGRLRKEPPVSTVTPAYGLDEARALARRAQPDVVMLDYHVHDELGTSLVAELRALASAPEVVMLSATDDPAAVVDALAAGASAWVVKGAPMDVLMQATDEVLHGRMYLFPTTVRPVVERLMSHQREADRPSFLDDLTDRQRDVLRCFVSGMSRAETARRLFITANTVRTHAQALLRASGEHTTLALVARARTLGVTGIDSPPPGSGLSS